MRSLCTNCVHTVQAAWHNHVRSCTHFTLTIVDSLIRRMSLCVETWLYAHSLQPVWLRLYTHLFTYFSSVKSHIIHTIHKTYYYHYYLYK